MTPTKRVIFMNFFPPIFFWYFEKGKFCWAKKILAGKNSLGKNPGNSQAKLSPLPQKTPKPLTEKHIAPKSSNRLFTVISIMRLLQNDAYNHSSLDVKIVYRILNNLTKFFIPQLEAIIGFKLLGCCRGIVEIFFGFWCDVVCSFYWWICWLPHSGKFWLFSALNQ